MLCPLCACAHACGSRCRQLDAIALSLDTYAVSAFLTDPLNRIVRVNRTFARLVGDPRSEGIPRDMRFVAATMLGPYRDKFPRRKEDVARCLAGMAAEVASGALATGVHRLARAALALDEGARRLADRMCVPWDGTVLVRNERRNLLVREHVIPLVDCHGLPNRFHISLWLPAEQSGELPPAGVILGEGRAARLTARQCEIACWYAVGLTSRLVAGKTGISLRTARDHLEDIYARLGVHSRAELTALLVREGLV